MSFQNIESQNIGNFTNESQLFEQEIPNLNKKKIKQKIINIIKEDFTNTSNENRPYIKMKSSSNGEIHCQCQFGIIKK